MERDSITASPKCGFELRFTPSGKAEAVEAATKGDLAAFCPYDDQVTLSAERQMQVAESLHDPPSD